MLRLTNAPIYSPSNKKNIGSENIIKVVRLMIYFFKIFNLRIKCLGELEKEKLIIILLMDFLN